MKAIITIIIIFIIGGGFLILRNGDTSDMTNESEVTASEDGQKEENDYDKIPDLSFEDYEGNTFTLSQFQGKPHVLNSWAVWCPFCRAELEDFAQLQEEFGNEITVVAIDRQESLEKAKGFTDEIGVTERMTFLLDPKDAFYKGIGGFSMPETIFADAEGNIIIHKRGPMDLDEMRQKVNSVINN
ncbi:MAG: TlpA family protein disulfide reductase [Candidatus Paceibacteria bacterium]